MEEVHLFLSRQQSETLKKVDQALKDVEYYRQVLLQYPKQCSGSVRILARIRMLLIRKNSTF
jgi:ABC-type oligopeptide transport system ATPase subunit